MIKPYVGIKRSCFDSNVDILVWGNGKDEWFKNLSEFTSWISVLKSTEEVIKFKKEYCEMISEDIGETFTIKDLDKIVTKRDYARGVWALAEYKHIVDTNIKCVKEGKEPFYLAPSLASHALIKALLKKENKDA